MKKGIYIAVHKDHNGNPYLENAGQNMTMCTIYDYFEQIQEAKEFCNRVGASQVYWFKEWPQQLENPNIDKVSFVINNGFLVCPH